MPHRFEVGGALLVLCDITGLLTGSIQSVHAHTAVRRETKTHKNDLCGLNCPIRTL